MTAEFVTNVCTVSQLKRGQNSNPFKYNTTRKKHRYFNYTNYANDTSFNKIYSLVSKI